MRIFKSKWFTKFARKERISDAKLCEAIRNAEKGIIDADYGGGVIKQRITRLHEGKSGGYRSIILFRKRALSFFVYGFAKSEQHNIDESDERDFKDLAKIVLMLSDGELRNLVDSGQYTEVKCDD
ncbi:type II toxin-antitoxin system RelE/ParE family toxin [Candidatus Contendibacter odensensis]|uniref:Addiction module toxin RelE n=1 Tax=Candidatus Contendobacter odensis Run_B_J11 TaxID=1400861 RepID=A0A7U7G9Q9_9GAMM|nr:type II toxin-antitoxin system RelE/ParE family toxin [Candidatus Contendobacter odensis]CDH44522.1 conserved hypothetical protein [Candidatus Contendobacter odensis Run_B_J11]